MDGNREFYPPPDFEPNELDVRNLKSRRGWTDEQIATWTDMFRRVPFRSTESNWSAAWFRCGMREKNLPAAATLPSKPNPIIERVKRGAHERNRTE